MLDQVYRMYQAKNHFGEKLHTKSKVIRLRPHSIFYCTTFSIIIL